MIGVQCAIEFGSLILTTITISKLVLWLGIIFIVALVPFAVCLFLFLRYLLNDNFTTRSNLVKGCAGVILANIIACIGLFVGSWFVEEIHFFQHLIEYGINILIWFYYRMICQMWAKLGDRTAQQHEAQNQRSTTYLASNPRAQAPTLSQHAAQAQQNLPPQTEL